MLIRKQDGDEFHIVCAQATRYFTCLCGIRIRKDCVSKQIVANGLYARCWRCRRIQNENLVMKKNLKVYPN